MNERAGSRRVAATAAFTCFWCVACAVTPLRADVASGSAGSRLARLSEAVTEHALRSRIDEPYVPGVPERAHIAPAAEAVLDSDRTFRTVAAGRLAAIETAAGALSPHQRADVRVLRGGLDRLAIERDELRRFQTDPARVWSRIDGVFRAILAARPGTLCRHARPSTLRMRDVPEALRAARIEVRDPSSLAVARAIALFGSTLELCRHALPALLLDCREAAAVGDFAVADTLASRALDSYVMWLGGDEVRRADESWRMGEDAYARWLVAATGTRASLDSLRAAAVAALAAAPPASPAALRDDSLRAALADSLLATRGVRLGDRSKQLRTAFGRRECAWGWGAYAQRLGMDRKGGAPEVDPRFVPSRLDLAGMIAEIDLHARHQSPDDVRAGLERDAGIDSAAAARELYAAALDPVRSVAAISAWQLEEVRATAAGRLGHRFTPRAFLAAAVSEGAVPVAAIREPLLRRLGAWADH